MSLAKRINQVLQINDSLQFQTRKKRDVEYSSITLLVLVNVILIGLVLLIGYIVYKEISLIYPKTLEELSVPCDDLSLSPEENFETYSLKKRVLKTYVRDDGQYMCSLKNSTELVYVVVERLSRMRISKGLAGRPYLSCGNSSLESQHGHLTVAFTKLSMHQYLPDDGSDVILHWDKHARKAVIDPLVQYQNGEITIAEGRTYYVYASVHFNISRQEDAKITHVDKLKQFSVRICRRVHGSEQTLLGRRKLFNTSNADAVSSFGVGSHLEMSKNDSIYIKVSDANSLILSSNGNSFGLFPI